MCKQIEMLRRDSRYGLAAAAALVMAGCAAPQPQVTYVPYPQPPPVAAAPAPGPAAQTRPTPSSTVRQMSEEDLQRGVSTWRDLCVDFAEYVPRFVYFRDRGDNVTDVRNGVLNSMIADAEKERRTDRLPADDGLYIMRRVAIMMTEQMIDQVFEPPYGSADQERTYWVKSCIAQMDGAAG